MAEAAKASESAASLSARRAWIEIDDDITFFKNAMVALRKESVDRNFPQSCPTAPWWLSLSARRAWIEIDILLLPRSYILHVALRKESVDRNPRRQRVGLRQRAGRSPQGERG